MPTEPTSKPQHPVFSRRDMLHAGSIGLLGLSMADVAALRGAAASRADASPAPRAVIYVFLTGGLAQHDSFDPKPLASDSIRGEFLPIDTRTPGIRICEHLPLLAQRSDKWALVRSLSHHTNGHSEGHHIMLTGRSDLPRGFSGNMPQPTDHPSLVSIAGYMFAGRTSLPASAVIPDQLIHHSGRVIPGQFAGVMGNRWDPWIVQASAQCQRYGACPNCFDHQRRPLDHNSDASFTSTGLKLAEGVTETRFGRRQNLLEIVEQQQRFLDRQSSVASMDRYRESAISLLTSSKVRAAFDINSEDDKIQDAYGRNMFGRSCLLARRLVEVGVGMVQINLGRNETWDTHGNAFPHLKHNLFPPTDRCIAALIDDLDARGLLESTMIVMAGEFGRTPRISRLPQFYELPGRDHWGAVQSVFFAGGGVRGGTVVGSSDDIGAYPKDDRQTPESMAATIFHALGLSHDAAWKDATNRPFHIYQAEPIRGLT